MAFPWVTQPLFGAPALPRTASRGRPQPSAALSLQGRWPTSCAATFLPVSITPSSNALFKERPAGHSREKGASSPGLVRGAGAAPGQHGGCRCPAAGCVRAAALGTGRLAPPAAAVEDALRPPEPQPAHVRGSDSDARPAGSAGYCRLRGDHGAESGLRGLKPM